MNILSEISNFFSPHQLHSGSVWIYIYILAAIVVTNLIRVIPILFIRGEIKNRFVRSFLYYVPYVTLAVMTFPAIINNATTPLAGIAALIVGIVAAWMNLGFFPVAALCSVTAYLVGCL